MRNKRTKYGESTYVGRGVSVLCHSGIRSRRLAVCTGQILRQVTIYKRSRERERQRELLTKVERERGSY